MQPCELDLSLAAEMLQLAGSAYIPYGTCQVLDHHLTPLRHLFAHLSHFSPRFSFPPTTEPPFLQAPYASGTSEESTIKKLRAKCFPGLLSRTKAEYCRVCCVGPLPASSSQASSSVISLERRVFRPLHPSYNFCRNRVNLESFKAILLSQVLTLLATALLSAAQSATTGSAVPTHTVAVGVDPHKFTPKEVNASIGDIIEFRFYPTNHSVARAEYLLPCIPYEVTGINKVGIWSGFKPIFVVGIDQPQYQVRINDTQPLFYYCGAPGACLVDGMVGVINPNATQTWEVQHAFALNATQMFVPGEYFSPEGTPTGSPTTSATTPSSTTSSLTGIPTQTTVVVSPGTPSGLSTGGIAGIAIGAATIAVLAGALFYLYGRQRTMKEVLQNSQNGPGFTGRGSYLSGLGNPMSQYPFIDHKLPTTNTQENSSDGRDRYSGVGQIDGHHNRSNPPDSESYRSRSPPIDDRDRDMQIPPLNMISTGGAQSPNSPQDYERRHDSINGAYLSPTPRGHLPEGEEEQAFRQRDSELRTDDVPAMQRVPIAGSQGANMTRVGVHEMPAPSLNSSGVSSYKPPGQIDTRPGGY